ncbi:hypothetical protein [Pseudoxanthomonas sp. UTMC 1351]|uniref:hypothetical protein n=1 Tax=Pseudoxanthomonas sp. UTMC 1351 TaxID=2695853 RepID=UPI0034CF73D2
MSLAIRARVDHVSELTRGQSIPLEPIADAHLDVIMETVARVWSELLDEGCQIVVEGNEAEINALIESRLNNLWKVDPLWSQLVTSVARGKESLSFDGAHLEKRPDLSIYLTGKHPSFPVIVECKIIDHASGKGMDLYCSKGISRFVNGQYAWASREAIMMGYIRDGSTVEEHLYPFLVASAKRKPDPWQTNQLPERAKNFRSVVSSSYHSRSFLYPSSVSDSAPGAIALLHLWLKQAKKKD